MDNSQSSSSSAVQLSNSTPSVNQDSSLQTSTAASVGTSTMMFDYDISNITLPTEASDDINSNTSNTSKVETSITNTTNSSTNHTNEFDGKTLKQPNINLTKPSNVSSSSETSSQDIPSTTNSILSSSPLITQPALSSITPPLNNPLPLPLIPQVYPFPLNAATPPLHPDLLKNLPKYQNLKAAIPRNQTIKGRPPKTISPVTSSPRPPMISNPLAAATNVARKGQPMLPARLPTQPIAAPLPLKSNNPILSGLNNPLTSNLLNQPIAPINNLDPLITFCTAALEQLKPEYKAKFSEDFNKVKLGQISLEDFVNKSKDFLTTKQFQTLQNIKIHILSKVSSPSRDKTITAKKRKLEENNQSALKKTKSEISNNNNNNNNNNINNNIINSNNTTTTTTTTTTINNINNTNNNNNTNIINNNKNNIINSNSNTTNINNINNNNNISYMGPPPPRMNQIFPIDTPGIGGNKGSSSTSKATQEIDVTKLDSESLGDVMKYVGVDLKEETDNILRDNEILNMQQQQVNQTDDRSKAQSFLSIPYLSKVVEEITSKNGINKVDPDYYNCLALAAQDRVRSLVEQMILASKHRVGLLHDFFMEESKAKNVGEGEESYEFSVVVKDDVKKALQLIERHERDKERRERQRRGEEEEGRGDGKDGDKGGSSKRKKNKTIKNKDVPDAVKQRITNETALRAAGGSGKKYSWMTQSSNDEWRASSLHFHKSLSQSKSDSKSDKKSGDESGKGFDSPKRAFGSSKSGKSSSSLFKRKDGSSQSRFGNSKNRNPIRRTISQKDMYRVILKDAIFILENDKYYKRSNLLYKWYTM
ncbi:hypothetical protein BCR32DRAFT_270176 [Anaeromyces robustus]|uniref:Transcription initiation factor TFIID subunit 4 n=1 Tax=Anaeromyces robustus TaxID=1754192 RepID=A0A1Y1WXE1_9FUNG|nr:hypothetical protein BCR32DRAFT_270176 [Anaeromyces robustus]|eukprot:ORX78239.1 hypothetical protein BCR32DRAFT_270176 [Anaeromyces robustus]